jgi:hypothetical protein
MSVRQMVYGLHAPEPSAAPCVPNLPNTGSGGRDVPNVPLILLAIIVAAAVVSRLVLRMESLR